MAVIQKILVALLVALTALLIPSVSTADSLKIGKLSPAECEWNGSQEHWQAGHPLTGQVAPNGMDCLIGISDLEKKFALIRLNGKVIRLVSSMSGGSPPKSFISADKKTKAIVVVTKTIDSCEKSSSESCCGTLLNGTLSVRHGNDTLRVKVHNYQGG